MTTTFANVVNQTLTSQATTSNKWLSDPIDVSNYDTLILSFVPTQFTGNGYIAINRLDIANRSDTMCSAGINNGDTTPVWLTVGPSDSYSATSSWGQHVQIEIGGYSGNIDISGTLCMDARG